ncbi:MAG TPA: M23 family metallopeptidase, partial [Vicinamibacteria bacterium]|nr:M23 family metallopeptidase [Vicinamibacteria bacterium]
MRRRAAFLLISFVLLTSGPAAAQPIVRQSGNATVQVDPRLAFPGGLFVVHVTSRRPLGGYLSAVFDGRRIPCFSTRRGQRALVPIPATLAAGEHVLGIEVRARRGRRRIAVPVTVQERSYPARSIVIPEPKRALVLQPGVLRDGRQVQLMLRTVSPVQQWSGPFKPPVDSPPEYSYGAPTTYVGGSPVESMSDAIFGEYHRGMDYPVAPGTLVQAPAAGMVLLARQNPLTGGTLLLDHGLGVVSAFFHLERIEVVEGQVLVGRTPIGIAGDTGIASAPHVHWGVYI